MNNYDEHSPPSQIREILQLMELAQIAVTARCLDEFVGQALHAITSITHSSAALLYIMDSQMSPTELFSYGFNEETTPHIREIFKKEFGHIALSDSLMESVPENISGIMGRLFLYPLQNEKSQIGILGIVSNNDSPDVGLINTFTRLVTNVITRVREKAAVTKQLSHLNAYLSISSMLAKSTGLQDILQIALYCSMEVVQAEAASVLILDENKENFTFYQVEGPMKPILAAAVFPAKMGIAGSVLESQQAEVINNVSADPRFYGNFDKESGFKTRNMIVIPLTAEEERIGVLEVINKIDDGSFSQEECTLLNSIAEEISFAIRNAKVFEFVADSYCKQRQGQMSCRGCKRPLGSWTPCMRYMQAGL